MDRRFAGKCERPPDRQACLVATESEPAHVPRHLLTRATSRSDTGFVELIHLDNGGLSPGCIVSSTPDDESSPSRKLHRS